jgi:gluconate:H+ symporter, GntP family
VLPFLLFLIGLLVVAGGILVLRLHAFLALLAGALLVSILTPAAVVERVALQRGASEAAAVHLAQAAPSERVAEAFGRTAGQIGLMIAMASIIGTCLLRTGSADRIVRSAVRWLGEERAAWAFLGSGFLLAIPVFFDTVFFLMIPLARAMRLRTGSHYLLYILAIIAGGTMAHSLVPPTPGPLFVAHELGVSMAMMIAVGGLVGACAALAGYGFARWADRQWEVPLRGSEASLRQMQELATVDDARLPPTWLALLPILLPVALITSSATLPAAPAGQPATLLTIAHLLGDRNVALMTAAVIGLLMLFARSARAARGATGGTVPAAIQEALTSAGVIILITGAGGAFGSALQQTGIGAAIHEVATSYGIPVLPLAFLLTALIRTALGSATVAMITAVGALSGLAALPDLGFHPVYLAMAIGCGSKPIWWMNDSGFWVVSRMSGMTERESLRTLTPLLLISGTVGFLVTLIAAWLMPLV